VKIIGATKYTFLVEMSPEEMYILSAQGGNGLPSRGVYNDLQYYAGREYKLNPAWERLTSIVGNIERLKTVVAQLRAMGELLEPVVPIVEELTGGAKADGDF
jgi:hypothetical protein